MLVNCNAKGKLVVLCGNVCVRVCVVLCVFVKWGLFTEFMSANDDDDDGDDNDDEEH